MPTPIFICGAECGIAAAGTASAGVEHWSSVTGAPAVVVAGVAGPAFMRSYRAFRFNPAAATRFLTHTLTAAVGSPATLVARFYVYFTSLPGADCDIFTDVATTVGAVRFIATGATIRARTGTTNAASGIAVTTGVWYRIDVKMVHNTTCTTDVSVDGSAAAQASAAGSASTVTGINLGAITSATADFYMDDLVVSGTSGDFPIGAGFVEGVYPSADGAHGGTWASGAFGKGANANTNAARTDTDIWQSLANPLVTTPATNFVGDITATVTTDYVEFRNGPLPGNAVTVHGAMLVLATHSATATANNLNFVIEDGAGHAATLISVLDLSESTITVPVIVRNTDGNGVAWTPTTIAANRNRFSSTDVNPDVFLDGFCWEVAMTASGILRARPLALQAVNRAGTY